MQAEGYTGWALVEVMGHRRLAGHVSEVVIAGAPMLRVDVPGKDADSPTKATQFYGGASIFCLITEEAARKEANPPEWKPTTLQLSDGEQGGDSDSGEYDGP